MKRWDWRLVTGEKYKEKIMGMTEKGKVGQYQSAVTSVYEDLGEQEREEIHKLVEKWNAEGPPQEVKSR